MRGLSIAETQLRRVIEAVRELAGGRINTGGTVTLTPSAVSTSVNRPGVQAGDHVTLMPQTASAQVAMVAGLRAVATATNTITITHASNAAVDQTFTYAFQASS